MPIRFIAAILVSSFVSVAFAAEKKAERKPAQAAPCREIVDGVASATYQALAVSQGLGKENGWLKLTREQPAKTYSVVGAVGGYDYVSRFIVDDKCVIQKVTIERNGVL